MLRLVRDVAWVLLLAACGVARAGEGAGDGAREAPGGASLIGIDHMPTVVADLDQASAAFRRLGFALKPGRAHGNGLRNRHVKFPDGSGIELLAVPAAPTDALTRAYAAQLRQGEGPAALAFHARDPDALAAALRKAGIGFRSDDGLVTLRDPRLDFVFFVRDNRSPSDRPEHFAHPNGATAMTEVWLALDAAGVRELRSLLLALGAVESSRVVEAPVRTQARVFALRNGRVVAVAARHRLGAGRPIIGAKFRVSRAPSVDRGRRGRTVQARRAHGLWVAFASDGKP